MALWLGVFFVNPVVLAPVSLKERLQSLIITLVVVAFCDWWFARRMGLSLDEKGLVLHYALVRRRVPWPTIDGFVWKRWRSTEWIWIRTDDGGLVRIPTVGRAPKPESLASSNLRSPSGEEVDAMATLNAALTLAREARSAAFAG